MKIVKNWSLISNKPFLKKKFMANYLLNNYVLIRAL